MKKYRIKEGSVLEFALFMVVVAVIAALCIAGGASTYLGA